MDKGGKVMAKVDGSDLMALLTRTSIIVYYTGVMLMLSLATFMVIKALCTAVVTIKNVYYGVEIAAKGAGYLSASTFAWKLGQTLQPVFCPLSTLFGTWLFPAGMPPLTASAQAATPFAMGATHIYVALGAFFTSLGCIINGK